MSHITIKRWTDGEVIFDGDRSNLQSANLRYADLRYADLQSADLQSANLRSADLRSADLPAPAMMLLASWGSVSDDLCRDLMRYDAANHPDPTAFDRWAAGGECPYSGVRVQRSANFKERRDLWALGPTGQPLTAFALMVRLIREKCANSDYHDHAKEA
jgi:hypothetical protein